VRAIALSVVLHALVAWWLWRPQRAPAIVQQLPPADDRPAEVPIEVTVIEEPAPARSGGGGGGGHRAARGAPVHAEARAEMTLGMDAPIGGGTGGGPGDGRGTGAGPGGGGGPGIGFGEGGGIAAHAAVPAPPAPPPPSRARPAKLLRPARDVEVIDDSYLFVARVTVDEDGDVAAVRMVSTHPGARGEQAASAIWTFHYAPALDDDGVPIRSTFEQPFQVR
jgi:hypothetical protein